MKRDEEQKRKAKQVGVGVLAGLSGYEGIRNELFDRAEDESTKKTRNLDALRKKMQPGDVVFHRTPNDVSSKALGHITTNDILSAVKGDPFYHTSIYTGKGLISEAGAGKSDQVGNSRLSRAADDDLRVYRPKLDPKTVAGAVDYAKANKGRQYSTLGRQAEHGLRHLFDPTGGPDVARPTCKGTACTELVTEAYPEVFKKRFISPIDMRQSKDMELVARYGKDIPVSLREKVLSRGVYPLLKNLKYGLGAGALAYGGMKAYDLLKDG